MATLGLNEEKMRRLAKTYDKDAKKLRDVGKDIERKLKTLDGQGWWGDDARRFADQWRDLQRSCLETSASTLDDYGMRLERNVQAQVDVSKQV